MKTFRCVLLVTLLASIHTAIGGPKPVDAFGRILYHKDGTFTVSDKQGAGPHASEIREFTYNKESVLIWFRIFSTDDKGRLRGGWIFDGKKNPKGSVGYGYDSVTGQIIEERLFNTERQLVRRLFYPGALKDPRYARRFVAFNIDPKNSKAPGVEETQQVKPIRPVESDQDEFEPGIPLGKAAPPANTAPAPAAQAGKAPSAAAAKRRSFLPSRKP